MSTFFLELSIRPTNFTPASIENAVFFDDNNEQVISVTNESQISVQTRKDSREHKYSLKSSGPVFTIKCSTSNKVLSVQRSQLSIDLFLHGNKSGIRDMMISPSTKTQINSFYWLSDTKLCIVTNKNIEVVQIFKDSGKSKLLASHNLTVYWCKYTSNTNTFVISSSPTDNILNLFRFENNQLVKLPKIQIPRGISIKEKTVWLLRLYGVAYVCHLFCINNEDRLILYNVSKSEKVYVEDAFFILGSPGEAYAVNSIDNLVMVHNMNSKSTSIFDIKSVPSEHGPSISGLNQSIKGYGTEVEPLPMKCPNSTESLYIPQIRFFQPNLVIDHRTGKLWEIELRLDMIVELFPNTELALRFLMRRKFNKSVIFSLFREAIAGDKRVPCERLARMFDQVAQNIKVSKDTDVVINQNEITLHIFSPLLSEKLIDYNRLVEVILLFIRALVYNEVKRSDHLLSLLIKSLIISDQSILIEQLILNGIIGVSPAVACSLLSNRETLQLGLDMLKRGGGNISQISEVLLTNNELIEALRYCPIDSSDTVNFISQKYLDRALLIDDEMFKTTFLYFHTLNTRATQANKQPPLPIPSKYSELYDEKFGSDDLKTYTSLLQTA